MYPLPVLTEVHKYITAQLVRHTLWFSYYMFALNHPDEGHVAETIWEINIVVEKSCAICLSIKYLK